MFRLAQSRCGLDQRIEHRLWVKNRAADYLEHFGGRRLLLQRFAELSTARLHLVEQADVLDGDDRLVGERGNKLDLLGGERLRRRSCDRKCPYRASLSQKRNRENGPVTAHLLGLTISVFRIGQHIGDMNRSVLDCRPPDCRPWTRRNRMLGEVFFKVARKPVQRACTVELTVT